MGRIGKGIITPILIFFDDWEIGIYNDKEEFFLSSGCEEYDFYVGLEAIADSSGAILKFDQRDMVLERTSKSIDSEYLVRKLSRYVSLSETEFRKKFKDCSSKDLINQTIKYYEDDEDRWSK